MTQVVSLITNDERAYKEVRNLTMWCKDNLSLNVITTKEFVHYRKRRTEHAPILIDGAVVEPAESLKFLAVNITHVKFENHYIHCRFTVDIALNLLLLPPTFSNILLKSRNISAPCYSCQEYSICI
jgi:hypothetical protein